MAVSVARSKTLPRPSAAAFWEAVLKTFSKTRGTASTKVGRKDCRSGRRFLMLGLWPRRGRDMTQPTWMIRAKTCASGRKSNVEAPSVSNRDSSSSVATPSSKRKLPCVSMQPFGRPVVPEV